VHAWRELLIDPVTLPSLDWDAVEQEAQAELAERLAGWREKYPDVDVQRLVVRDGPARVLVEQSARAQLVVVGSHGRGGAAGLVLGSVSHAVLHRADCPVVIVRSDVEAAR
jgi:nucleotide-binding universal stress UspA family protein